MVVAHLTFLSMCLFFSLLIALLVPKIIIVGGWGSKTVDKIGKGIFEEVNLKKYWWYVLGKYSLNLGRGWTTIVDKGTEDSYITSESRESGVKGAQRNSREENGNLALNKKEKKKEGQISHPLLIKCTATT